jgi:bifunctional DNA-binding transcriptional regulator/antitoxin component of YhaV-PrlF toxin-antitoxin module
MAAETATLPRTVKMWGRGQLTIPRDIREEIGFGENTVASIVGISLKDLIRDLERERDRYNRENYPS